MNKPAVIFAFPLLTVLSGCAADPDGSDADLAPPIEESQLNPQTVTGVTAPPAGVGISWIGNFKVRLANSMNRCTYIAAGNEVKTKACDATAQTWAVYNAGNHYNFCKPNTLKLFGGYYVAECWISDQSKTTNPPGNAPTIVYDNVALAQKGTDNVWREALSYEASTNSYYGGNYLMDRFHGAVYLSEASTDRVLTKAKYHPTKGKPQLWELF